MTITILGIGDVAPTTDDVAAICHRRSLHMMTWTPNTPMRTAPAPPPAWLGEGSLELVNILHQ